jgi:uncharacterized protein
MVSYHCQEDKTFTAQFYNGFDPAVAVLRWGGDSAVTFAEPSGSGVPVSVPVSCPEVNSGAACGPSP